MDERKSFWDYLFDMIGIAINTIVYLGMFCLLLAGSKRGKL